MRNPERIPVFLDIIKHVWEKHPDLRFCQLISIMRGQNNLFAVEDYDFLESGTPRFGFEVDEDTWKLPQYFIEPNAFKELIQSLSEKAKRDE